MEQKTHIYYYDVQGQEGQMPERLLRAPKETEETPFEKWWATTTHEYATQAEAMEQHIAGGDMIDIILSCRNGKYSMVCADYPMIWAYKSPDERFQLPKEGEELRMEVTPISFRRQKRCVEVSHRKSQENLFENIKKKYKVGDVIEGRVKTYNPKLKMLFVNFGDLDGVLFPDFLIRPITTYSEGEKLKAYVTGIDDTNRRLTFSQTFNQLNPPLREADQDIDVAVGEERQVTPITFNPTNRDKGEGWVKVQYGDYFGSMSSSKEHDMEALAEAMTLGQPITCIYCGVKAIGKKSQMRWCMATEANKERIQTLLPYIDQMRAKSADGTVDISEMQPITATYPLDIEAFIKEYGHCFDAEVTGAKTKIVNVRHTGTPDFEATLTKADLLRHPLEYKEGEKIRIYLNSLNPAEPRPLGFKEGGVCRSVQRAVLTPTPKDANVWKFALEQLLQEGDTLQAVPFKAEGVFLILGYCGYTGIIRFDHPEKLPMLMRRITLGEPMQVVYKDITTFNRQERLEFTLTPEMQLQIDDEFNTPKIIEPEPDTRVEMTVDSITDDTITGHAGAHPIRVATEGLKLKADTEEIYGALKDIIPPGTRLPVEVTGKTASKKSYIAVLASEGKGEEPAEPGEKEATIVSLLDHSAILEIEGAGLCFAAADALADTVGQLDELAPGDKVRVNFQLYDNVIPSVSHICKKTYPFAPGADHTEAELEVVRHFAKFTLAKDREGRIIRIHLSKLGGKFGCDSYKQFRHYMLRPEVGSTVKCLISRCDNNRYCAYQASLIGALPDFEDRLYRQIVRGRVICQTTVNDMAAYIVDIGTRLGFVTQDKFSWRNGVDGMASKGEELEFVSLGYMSGTMRDVLNLSRLSFETVNLTPGKCYKGKTTAALHTEDLTGIELRNGYTVYVPTAQLHSVPGATSPIGDGAIMPDCPVTVKFMRPDLKLAKLIGSVDNS